VPCPRGDWEESGDLTISSMKNKQSRKQSPNPPAIENPRSVKLLWDISKELERVHAK